jgi:hypothetical protein
MRAEDRQRFNELCGQAISEPDPEKLKLINQEIDRLLLDEKFGLRPDRGAA